MRIFSEKMAHIKWDGAQHRKNENNILGCYSEEWYIADLEAGCPNIHYSFNTESFLRPDFEREINCFALQKYEW